MKNFLLCGLLSCLTFFANGESPQVTVEQGVLRGSIKISAKNSTFYSFTGIPYAKPPIDSYRFEPPQPPEKWTGIYNATGLHAQCIQFTIPWGSTGYDDSEDCLYLNVYTPQLSSPDQDLLPVMFFIHGGGFFKGSANYDSVGPQILMDKNVVLVTANYRLGVLGFFSTGDEVVPGNMGLKDQAFALKWVSNNIQHFGGDPKNVTLFGHSVGGTSAHLHMFSPLSKGLFHGVIAQSGTAFSRWALFPPKDLKHNSATFADIVMCKKETVKETMECLKMVRVTIFIRAMEHLDFKLKSHMFYFGPVVESNTPSAFISGDPLTVIKSGQAANVPLITGVSSEDGSMMVANVFSAIPTENREEYFQQKLPYVLWYNTDPDPIKTTLTNEIKARYLDDNPTVENLTKMCTHGLFLEAAYETISTHLKYSNEVYFYLFEYRGSGSYAINYNVDGDFGVTHGDDLLYLFQNNAEFPSYIPSKSDQKVVDLLSTLWTNFAKYGTPTPFEDQQVVRWQPVGKNKTCCYHFKNDTSAECKECLFKNDVQFWTDLRVKTERKYSIV